MPIDDDLELLEKSIRRLQIEWDKFFSGVERKPPNELQTKVEALVRRHAGSEIRNNADRFRHQNLTARFNTFNELWAKRLRAREEGKAFGVHGLKADVLPPPAPPPLAVTARAARAQGDFRVSDPARDGTTVRALYDQFLEERKRAGERGAPSYESFQKLISQQTARIQSEKGAHAVDFRLEMKDGKVSLKARLVK